MCWLLAQAFCMCFFFGFVTSAKKNGFGGENVAGLLPGEWRWALRCLHLALLCFQSPREPLGCCSSKGRSYWKHRFQLGWGCVKTSAALCVFWMENIRNLNGKYTQNLGLWIIVKHMAPPLRCSFCIAFPPLSFPSVKCENRLNHATATHALPRVVYWKEQGGNLCYLHQIKVLKACALT